MTFWSVDALTEVRFLKTIRQFVRRHHAATVLWLSFLLPMLIMGGYFAYRHMAPFGNSSLLTVDLGQQYVDFFAYFRHSLLHDPSGIFYTFQKALGGEMFGIWTYYLLSPFNLILLIFPDKLLPSAIFVMTVAKYGAAGLSFAWLLIKSKLHPGFSALIFSTSYALMGWMIANQLNLMWLDAVILLPLIIWGLLKLVSGGQLRTYVIWLTALLIINYYMAYMVCLFTGLFFLWLWLSRWQSWTVARRQLRQFIVGSFLSACIAAVTLLPTIASLLLSKAQYTQTNWHFKFEYFPPKMLAKFFLGSFNFNQMPKGTPNLFIGSIVLLGCLFFFTQARHSAKTRWLAAGMTLILLVSACFEPLNLIWHAMQFPIWYPYRFSFVISFWLVWLAANALQRDFIPKLWQISLVGAIVLAGVAYVWLNLKQFSFLTQNQVLIGLLFLVAAMCLIALPDKGSWLYQAAVISFVAIEMTSNAVSSLNHISYVTQSDYQTYYQTMTQQTHRVTNADHGWYRLTPTFMRTKNDPMSGQFNGGSVFSSTLEKDIPAFMGSIGQPDGDGFVAYTNGTLLTDALLNFKYLINQQSTNNAVLAQSAVQSVSTRADLKNYKTKTTDGTITTYQNPNTLSLGFMASDDIRSLHNTTKDPTQYQANLFAALTGQTKDQHLFTAANFDRVVFQNIKQQTKLTGAFLQKSNFIKPGVITFYFTPKTNNAYYLTLGSNLNDDNVTMTLNGHSLSQYPTYRHTIVVNLADHQKGQQVKLQLTLKKSSLWLQNFTLYQFNNHQFNTSLKQLKAAPLTITHHSQRSIQGTVNVKANKHTLMTTIPYSSGWHVKVDGKTVQPFKVSGTFMALKLTNGHHTISLRYWPPLLNLGLLISLLSLLTCLAVSRWRRR